MASHVGRRKFLATLGGAAAAWPRAARAQQPERMRRIGLLQGLAESDPETQARTVAFRQALEALGWIEGRNIHIDYRFAGGDPARVQAYAVELVNAAPDLIVAVSTPAAMALKQATRTIPIVLAVVNDPLGQGFVASLARPGGNITGFANIEFTMVGQGLELLKEMAPSVRRVALIFNPLTAPYYPLFLRELEASPARLPAELAAAPVHDEGEVEAAIATLAREPAGGLIAAGDPFINAHRALIMRLAQHHRLPAIYAFRQFVAEGGLMSYGPDSVDIARRSASYVDRILKGTTPAELPVQQPTKFKLAINLKTAKALGLTAPDKLLAIADEVIE
jgi:putative tryptophan/tyrosine transport system substrate-binding protein